MKRLLSFILAVVFVCGIIVYAVAAPYTGVIDAKSVLLINMDTGEVLHSSNPTDKVYPAGTTKLMTALVAYELCEDLDEPFVIADEALADITEGTDKTLAPMLRPGETVTMRDILGGVLVGSGNDAAAVAAYHSAGSVPDFIAKMNEKAEKLGMTGTHFTNPHGRSGDEHYTTATDMGKLMTQIYKIPALMGILNQKSVTIAGSDTTTERVITSVNLFYTGNDVQKYSLGTGSLGGYLDIAGGCLVSGAEKDGVRLLCMIFEEPTVDGSWVAAKSLFEYAFELTVEYTAEELFKDIPLVYDEKFELTPDYSGISIEVSKYYDISDPTVTLEPPTEEDSEIGSAKYYAKDGKLLAIVPVTFKELKPPLILRILKVILIIVIVIVLLIILAFVALKLLNMRHEREKARRRAEREARKAQMLEEQRMNIDFSEFKD